jgi:hypothetical protein
MPHGMGYSLAAATAATSGGVGSAGQESQEPAAKPTAAETEQPQEQDMAERYFPHEDERRGTRASGTALFAMLIALVAAIHVILQSRDVH